MSYKNDRGVVLPDISEFLAEWSIEDSLRYEQLALRTLKRDPPPAGSLPRPGFKRTTRDQGPAKVEVVLCVLEIPRQHMARATNELRASPNIKPASYLPKLQAHATGAIEEQEEMLRVSLVIKDIIELTKMYANKAGPVWRDECDVQIEKILASRPAPVDHLRVFRAALLERKTEVAAQLLASLPDDET
jgi:hypothetical protein